MKKNNTELCSQCHKFPVVPEGIFADARLCIRCTLELKVENMRELVMKYADTIEQLTEDNRKHQVNYDNLLFTSQVMISSPRVRLLIKIEDKIATIRQKITLFYRSILAKISMPPEKEILKLLDKVEKIHCIEQS